MIHSEDPRNPQGNRSSGPESSEGALTPQGDSVSSGSDAFSFAPGEWAIQPDPGMSFPLGLYSLVDFIDDVLVKKVPAEYDDTSVLIDVSALVLLVNQLDSVSMPMLGGAIMKPLAPAAWSQSIEEINLAFEYSNDPMSVLSFEKIGCAAISDTSSPDCWEYEVKLGRFVESIRSLYEYLAFQKSIGSGLSNPTHLNALDTFLSHAMEQASTRSKRSS